MLDTQTADVFSQYNFSSVAQYLTAKSGANPLSYNTYATVIGLPGASRIDEQRHEGGGGKS